VKQLNKLTLPTFFEIFLDFIPIQASAVPSERVFSLSAETNTKKQNHINPVLMEALQMLKFALKQSRLDFTKGWIMPQSMLQEQEPELGKDLGDLLRLNSEDVVDNIIQLFGECYGHNAALPGTLSYHMISMTKDKGACHQVTINTQIKGAFLIHQKNPG
jgi:hypothetical protein